MKEATNFLIAIGSNVNQQTNINQAKTELKQRLGTIKYTAELCTEPIGITSDKFLNLLAWGETTLSVFQLEETLKEIEKQIGGSQELKRQGIVRIDLDLLQYNESRFHSEDWKREYIQTLLKMRELNI